jgi:hypothetical protein
MKKKNRNKKDNCRCGGPWVPWYSSGLRLNESPFPNEFIWNLFTFFGSLWVLGNIIRCFRERVPLKCFFEEESLSLQVLTQRERERDVRVPHLFHRPVVHCPLHTVITGPQTYIRSSLTSLSIPTVQLFSLPWPCPALPCGPRHASHALSLKTR